MKSRAGLLREERQEGTGEGGADRKITYAPFTLEQKSIYIC